MAAIVGIVSATLRRAEARMSSQEESVVGEPTQREPDWDSAAHHLPRPEHRRGLSRIQRLRVYLWLTFEDPDSSAVAKYVSIVIMGTIALSVTAFISSSRPIGGCEWNQTPSDPQYGQRWCPFGEGKRFSDEAVVQWIEFCCVIIFTTEYVVRLACCTVAIPLSRFFSSVLNAIDLASIAPWYINQGLSMAGVSGDARFVGVLRVVRLVRVVRIFKLSRAFHGLHVLMRTIQRSGPAIFILFSLTILFNLLFGTLIYMVEGGEWEEDQELPGYGQFVRSDGAPSPFTSIPVAIYWTMVTMSTVGYGDITPITPLGFAIGAMTMLGGLVVLSLPITIISANFDEETRVYERFKRHQRRKKTIAMEQQKVRRDTVRDDRALLPSQPEASDGATDAAMSAVGVGGSAQHLAKQEGNASPGHCVQFVPPKGTAKQSQCENSDGSAEAGHAVHDDSLLEQMGLPTLEATLADYRDGAAHDLVGLVKKAQLELAEHACKLLMISEVFSKGERHVRTGGIAREGSGLRVVNMETSSWPERAVQERQPLSSPRDDDALPVDLVPPAYSVGLDGG